MSSPPSSPLSPYSSAPSPPRKRRVSAIFTDDEEHSGPGAEVESDISSDTTGSVPNSPGAFDPHDDDPAEQISICKWDGCNMDLKNMDDLVKHIHEEHIGTRKATYACMWDDCTRKGMAHASGYALRAHMRSHTKEKPFYCSLPGKFLQACKSCKAAKL